MSTSQLNLNSVRAKKARLARIIGKSGYRLLLVVTVALSIVCIYLFIREISVRGAYVTLSLGLVSIILVMWYARELDPLPSNGDSLDDRLSGATLGRLPVNKPLTPQSVWGALSGHWQTLFITNHFLLGAKQVEEVLSDKEEDMKSVWDKAAQLAADMGSKTIEPAHVTVAMLLTSPNIEAWLTRKKLSLQDVEAVVQWLGRALEVSKNEKPYFGGIGRDWANGFTPQLNQYGHNISLALEAGGANFGWLTTSPGVTAIKTAFSQGAPAVALIGQPGGGKTSHVYALAQLLLAEKNDRNLEHRQVVSLTPSVILSRAKGPGDLERIIMTIMHETAHAGHIILFLDDAQLFFGSGVGSFDATPILLQVVQSGAVQLIFAMTPNDYQELKARNSAFAALLTPVVLGEPDEATVMRVLEDTALGLEHKQGVLITYEALKEAYRLSGRYEQEVGYPGKAIQLLERSLTHPNEHSIITAVSVQQAIEQSHGVKVGTAAPVEADILLHLEDKIHQRMINQTRAVKVVSSALRRARAGVANPNRPLGSFLFLGPTGVGKTELAKAIAAEYFGSEENMIRLDMSEYQQPDDVNRLLSDGSGKSASLIMSVRQQPFSVVLLDEIEKTHPNILNLLLQLLDEGRLTDIGGKAASFKDCIIIATSNAGAQVIRDRIAAGESLESFESAFFDELIKSNQFKPELLNRFDEIVLFRPLNQEELAQVVGLMMQEINKTLSQQNITVELTRAAALEIVAKGYDARLGARPMRRMLQRTVEDSVANRILSGATKPGDHVTLDTADLGLE